jgi:catechol 1,2-dioxygenase
MIIERQQDVTDAVLHAMAQADSPRLREIMESLVRHAHAFAREARLSEEEWEIGVDFLNRIGQATNDRHNEGVLFSDAIGLSTLICLMNNGNNGATETASALLGPFWRMRSPRMENGGSIVRSATPGPALFAACRVLDPQRRPIAGVEVDIWQSSPAGLYENQDPAQADMNLRGKFVTDSDGRFAFQSVKPGPYPVPVDGPVGALLKAQNRHPYRPAHLHFLCFKQGYKTLVTQVFVDADEYLDSDVVFGVTRALVGAFAKGEGTPPWGEHRGEWVGFDHTFVMEPGVAQLPQPPIK